MNQVHHKLLFATTKTISFYDASIKKRTFLYFVVIDLEVIFLTHDDESELPTQYHYYVLKDIQKGAK